LKNSLFNNLSEDKFPMWYLFNYFLQVIKLRRMRWADHVACVIEKRNACRLLVGMPEGNKPVRRLIG
jgi:hypothetical protein